MDISKLSELCRDLSANDLAQALKMHLDFAFKTFEQANDAYYLGLGSTVFTDAEYDNLRSALNIASPNDSRLKAVGATPKGGHLKQVKLETHMGSQNHATTDEMFYDWYAKHNEPEVIITDKVDGNSVEIIYENGILVRAASRGDGITGQDITENARYWGNLPKTIKPKSRIILRGEAVLYKELWEKHFSDKANPRNAGTGITLRKSDQDGNKHINIHIFDINVQADIKTQLQKLKLIESLGFETVRYFVAKGKDQVGRSWKLYNEKRNELKYEIDGAVVCINDIEYQKKVGFVDNRPKGQIAWKFKSQEKITKIKGMTITLGKSGNIIPTAILEPVYIGGITVRNALLTTFSRLEQLGINIGDDVMVQRAGDVIPYIDRVVKKHSKGTYPRPTNCPYCNTKLQNKGAYLICPDNEGCPGQVFRRIEGWIKKNDIKQFGITLLETLYDKKIVTKIADIYSLDWDEVAKVEVGNGVLGTSLANKIKAEVDKTLGMPVDEFIGSIGIKDIGRSTAKSMGLKTVDDFINLTESQALGLPGIGQSKAESIVKGLQAFKNEIIELAAIIKPADIVTKVVGDGPLKGQSFCFTGIRMSLSETQKLADMGGVEKSGVSKDLTYLVCADVNSDSGKAKKARSYGTKIISMDDFKNLLTTK